MHMVVGDRYTVSLFKLMGFEGRVVDSPREALEFIRSNLDVYDVFLVSSGMARHVRKELDELRLRNPRKMFVEVPSVLEGMEREVNYLQLVRQILGG